MESLLRDFQCQWHCQLHCAHEETQQCEALFFQWMWKWFPIKSRLPKTQWCTQRPLQCDKCEKKCLSSSQLKRRIRKIHLCIEHECRYGCWWYTPLDSNMIRHEKQCRSNPIPGAPWSVANGCVLQTYQASKS